MQNKIQNRLKRELKQVTTARIKGKTFKTAVIVEDENKILIFFDDGSFLVENKICKVDPRSPMGYSKGCPLSRSAMTESMDLGSISDGYHTFNELYEHRHALVLALISGCSEIQTPSFRTAFPEPPHTP